MSRARILTSLEKFWAKTDQSAGPNGCWNWTACTGSAGYGQVNPPYGKMIPAHRFSYELHRGPIPDGLYVCHSCDNRRCVNPAHLWLGTHEDNMRDMVEKRKRQKSATKLPKVVSGAEGNLGASESVRLTGGTEAVA